MNNKLKVQQAATVASEVLQRAGYAVTEFELRNQWGNFSELYDQDICSLAKLMIDDARKCIDGSIPM